VIELPVNEGLYWFGEGRLGVFSSFLVLHETGLVHKVSESGQMKTYLMGPEDDPIEWHSQPQQGRWFQAMSEAKLYCGRSGLFEDDFGDEEEDD
jgi:hypothetical protein